MPPDNEPIDLPAGTDYRDAAASVMRGRAALAGVNANADPEAGARSAQLGAATGVPSNIINLDPKRFEERLKTQVTQGIVGGNQSLAEYAGSDPMASIVSNDDWGHLDTFSHSLKSLREATDMLTQPLRNAVSGAATGFAEGIGTEPLTSLAETAREMKLKSVEDLPEVAAVGLLNNVLESVMRVGSGVFGAVGGAITGALGEQGIGRDIRGMAEYEMFKPEAAGMPWLMAGHEPPAGVNPEFDKTKVERNEHLLKTLEDAGKLVQKSTTWERSPELFKKFVQQHLGDRSISIAGDAVTTLYGDKEPEAGDGKLGWVPNIADQLESARSSGADVEVPLADWLTHMDPAVAKELHDNIRMWPEGITKAESTVERPPVPPPTPTEVGQVRQAGGLDPVFRPAPEPVAQVYQATKADYKTPYEEWVRSKGETAQPWIEDKPPAVIRYNNELFIAPEHLDAIRMASDKYGEQEVGKALDAEPESSFGSLNKQGQFETFDRPGYKGTVTPTPWSLGAAPSDYPMLIGLDTIDPKAIGLPEGMWQHLQELARDQYAEDVAIAQRRAERQQKREQTAEWKSNRKDMEKEVEADLRAQPHIATDMFIGAGELSGEKVQQRFTLREDDLNDAQKAALPAHYVSKNGLPIDDVAALFGYGSGDAMVDVLATHNAMKAGRSPGEMLRDMIKTETDRRMQAKYGDLPSNILTAAHDQALSDTTLNIVTQEYQGAAMSAKVEFLQDAQIRDEAKRIADAITNKDVNSRKKLSEVSKNYSDAIKGLLGGDAQAAVIALQRRAIGAHVAKELMRREEQIEKFDKLAKGYAKRWDPTKAEGQKIAPDWSLFIRDVLGRVGMKNGMSPAWMAQEIKNSRFPGGLADFVAKTEAESHLVDLHLPIPDFLYEPGVKNIKDMPGDEFRAVADAVKVMDTLGRADQKAEVRGQKITKDEWVARARLQLADKFDPLPAQRRAGILDVAAAASTSAETVFQRFDGKDRHGLFTETFIYPMAEGSNFRNRIEREESKKYRDLGEITDKKKLLDSPIIDPHTKKPWANFTRENLHAVISNMGNEYNWRIANEGWGTDPNLMMQWVEAHSTPEDIKRAQDLGNQFGALKPRIDTVDRNVYGIASESVQPRPFVMHGQQWEGWYHPIIGDPNLSRYVNKMPSIEKEPANFWPSVYNKFLKKRTGAVQFIDLTYDSIPSRLLQEIHYLAMHEPVMNAAKLIRDGRFRDDVIKYYGKEYLEVIDNWLHTAAGDASYSSGMMAQANKWSGILRQNVVNTLIGFNTLTAEKHGLTAFAYSLRELAPKTVAAAIPTFTHVTAQVAPGLFKHAVLDMFGKSPALGDGWFDFSLKNSEELQRRVRNFQDTMMGVHQMFDQGWSLRNLVSTYGAKMVAFSDMLSAAPLWLARYRAEMGQHGMHGDAVRAADLAVRNAHGSTAVTNRPMITTGSNPVTPWLTSLYGFMGTSMQRRIEILHDINDAYDLGMKGDIKAAAAMTPQILSGLAIYVLWTGYIEEKVTGQFTEDHRGLLAKTSSFLFGSIANSIIGLRDLFHDVEYGSDSLGLSPAHDFANILRDVTKKHPLAKDKAGKLVQDSCSVIGDMFGYCPKHVGTVMRYGMDAFRGVQNPRSGADIYRGAITGSQKLYQRR